MTLLETRAIDYAFLLRSTAEDHHLKITALPPDQNLSQPALPEELGPPLAERMNRVGP